MHEVHTSTRRGTPFTSARTRCTLGFHRRFVRTCECETDRPHDGCLPQTSHTAATRRASHMNFRAGLTSIPAADGADQPSSAPAVTTIAGMATTLASMAGKGVGSLEGVGDKRREALHVLGVDTLADLVTFYPRRWIDRTSEARVRDLVPGQEALLRVTLRPAPKRPTRNRRSMV